ncbi:MAG: outer-membrane lipoprotein carrier protein LolA [Rickettsiaceae bacterium]|nr:outer-membrane lipoprotein carrier protein LolA [Rickettsiaceae bacterium]
MKKHLIKFIITFLGFMSNDSFAIKKCEQNSILQIESYLKSISSHAITFEQIESDQTLHTGVLLIKKPDIFRANYDSPHPLVIVGSKNFVSLYDYELDELSRVEAKDNIFKFLLEKDLSIQKNINIQTCQEDKQFLALTLSHAQTQQIAKVIFKKSPFALHELVTPEDGVNFEKNVIIIRFGKVYNMSKYLPELFTLKNPKVYGPPKRYKSDQIIKMIEKK